MDEKDLFRFRAEEFERNFESLRGIEWRTAIQVFSGYAAIGIAYYTLHDKYGGSWYLGLTAIFLTLILYAANTYLACQVQKRLHFTRSMMKAYLQKLHEVCGVPELDIPAGANKPGMIKWWAFVPQVILSTAAMLALLVYVYVAVTTPWCQCK